MYKKLLVLAIVAALVAGVAAIPQIAAAQTSWSGGATLQAQSGPGTPGPSGISGELVDPYQLPPAGDTSEGVREVARQRPDQTAFERLKKHANDEAVKRAGGQVPGGNTGPAPDFDTISYTGWNPPDGALAVGPTSVLVAVNESFALYDKAGATLLSPRKFQDLFGTNDSIFDPRALFDAGNAVTGGSGGGSGRFVLLATAVNSKTRTSYYTLAISQDDTPQKLSDTDTTTRWAIYKINALTGANSSLAWADFPGLGMDGANLYITSNQFGFSSGFQQSRLLIVPKAQVYPDKDTGGPPALTSTTDFQRLTNPDGSLAFTVQPASRPDALPGDTGIYLVDSIWNGGSQLAVRGYDGSSLRSLR